jgi:hypothetical protein
MLHVAFSFSVNSSKYPCKQHHDLIAVSHWLWSHNSIWLHLKCAPSVNIHSHTSISSSSSSSSSRLVPSSSHHRHHHYHHHHQHNTHHQIKGNEMGKACSSYAGQKSKNFSSEILGKR